MTESFYRLPADLAEDIEAYEREVSRFLSKELAAPIFKARRVSRGVYEQRQNGTYMVRIRVAAGSLTAEQCRILAESSREFGNGLLHITTRQDIQLHDIAIQNTPKIMRRAMTVGLTTKGGGGNTVRNVTACSYAGMCTRERFDATGFAHAVTEYLIALVGSYNLPRKYKIAFSGCSADCGLAQISDLGFVAEVRGGRPGFRVFGGGGMGAHGRVADLLLDWTPATEVIRIAEAVRRLLDQLGDRTNRNRARLRFVAARLGKEAFQKRVADESRRVTAEGVPQCKVQVHMNDRPDQAEVGPPKMQRSGDVRYLVQPQDGWVAVPLSLPLGFLSADEFARIGELASRFSDKRELRTTRRQSLLIPSVKRENLPSLVAEIHTLATDVLSARALERFVACAGASTCRLGLCLARNAASASAEKLDQGDLATDTLDALEVHINGCPNACGHQPIAMIGCSGAAQRVGRRLVPSYRITLGGRSDLQGARLGTSVGQVPAKALPDFLSELAGDFERHRRADETFVDYFDRQGQAHFSSIVNQHARVPPYEERPDYYRDFGEEEDFSLAGRGAGECGAGIFEVIQEDLAMAARATEPFDVLLPTARALLITRGIDAQDPDTVFREFEKHFVGTGLVNDDFRPLLTRARGHAQGWKEALLGSEGGVNRLLERVKLLYATLDASLEFHPPERENSSLSQGERVRPAPPASEETELDLRGVACPMNFVKAKLRLESMEAGRALAIILDEGESIRNVPASLRNEGQEVQAIADLGDGHWRVIVRKK